MVNLKTAVIDTNYVWTWNRSHYRNRRFI